MKVELFQTAGCKRCEAARNNLRAFAEQAVPGLIWRDVDAAAELDYLVSVGVMSLPALAVDGHLVFSSLPTPEQLAQELHRRTAGATHGR